MIRNEIQKKDAALKGGATNAAAEIVADYEGSCRAVRPRQRGQARRLSGLGYELEICRAEGRGATFKPLSLVLGVYRSDNRATFANLCGRSG